MTTFLNKAIRPSVRRRALEWLREAELFPLRKGEDFDRALRRAEFARWQLRSDVQLRVVSDMLGGAKLRPLPHDSLSLGWLRQQRALARRWDTSDVDIRRACWRHRRDVSDCRVIRLAKGCAKVSVPKGTVAFLGGGESSYVVFLDRFGRPIEQYQARSDGPQTWAQPTSWVPSMFWTMQRLTLL